MKKFLIGIVFVLALISFLKSFYPIILGAIVIYFILRSNKRKNGNSLFRSLLSLFSSQKYSGNNNNDYSPKPIRSINDNGGKRFGFESIEDEKRKKDLADQAYFYRRHGGPRWKIESADKELGRSQWESDYYDDKYER